MLQIAHLKKNFKGHAPEPNWQSAWQISKSERNILAPTPCQILAMPLHTGDTSDPTSTHNSYI